MASAIVEGIADLWDTLSWIVTRGIVAVFVNAEENTCMRLSVQHCMAYRTENLLHTIKNKISPATARTAHYIKEFQCRRSTSMHDRSRGEIQKPLGRKSNRDQLRWKLYLPSDDPDSAISNPATV